MLNVVIILGRMNGPKWLAIPALAFLTGWLYVMYQWWSKP